jgi:hypothetical protein
MMGRLKSDQGQLFYEFHLSNAVPMWIDGTEFNWSKQEIVA